MELFRQSAAPISDAELNARLQAAITAASHEAEGGATRGGSGPGGGPPDPGSGTLPSPGGDTIEPSLGGSATLRRAYDFGRAHVVAIGVALACVLGFTSFQLLRAGAMQVPVVAAPASVPLAPSTAPASEAPPTTSAPPVATIQVHVIGEVRRPGVVRLPLGSRIADAITAAGGLTPIAKPGDLNLAAPLVDGCQVVVGGGAWPSSAMRTAPGAAGQASGGAENSPLNLNTATAQELEALPGVGPVTAQRILEWRQAHGRFTSVTELQEVSGIGPKLYAKLAPLVTV